MVKDSFLLYYPESEKREFDKRKCLSYQPNGLMPLGDCSISTASEPSHPFLISIVNELSQVRMIFTFTLIHLPVLSVYNGHHLVCSLFLSHSFFNVISPIDYIWPYSFLFCLILILSSFSSVGLLSRV